MKIKVLILMITALMFGIQYLPDTYAYSTLPITVTTMEGDIVFGVDVSNNNVYVTFDYESDIDIRHFDLMERIIVRYKTLYETFIVTSSITNDVLLTLENFEYIEIDTLRASEGYMTIRTESVSHDIFFNPSNQMFFPITIDYELAADDLLFISDVDNPIEISEINQWFLAWDNYDGDVTENIIVFENQYIGNEHSIGDYTVTLSVSDSSLNKSYLTYTISVRDMASPIISPLSDINVSYKDVYNINQIIDNLEVYDNVNDIDNIEIMIISNSYDANKAQIGAYEIVLQATDASGNSSTAVQIIHVIDDVAPVISGLSSYTISVDDYLPIENILANLTVFDEKDPQSIDLIIESSTYVEGQKGESLIVVSATDQSGNVATYHISIQVTDLIPPVFYINLSQITTTVSSVFSESELLVIISEQIPFVFESLSITLNEYLNNESNPGIYRVQLSAKNGLQVTNLQTLIRVNEAIEEVKIEEAIWYEKSWFITGVSVSAIIICFGVIYFIKKKRS